MNVLCICRKFLCVAASLAMAVSVNSCFDDSALKNSIDDLKDRVEALENFQKQVQGDIASLQEIIAKLQSSVTVNNVVETENGYTINFSDGTSVTISNGKDGMTPPSITVVEEDGTYYWAYEKADGSTEFILDGEGNKIPVTGEAPQVRINENTGNWEISTDGGQNWEDTGVKAEGSDGDSFFSNVEIRDGILYLVLSDGTAIEIPMTAELAFDFGTEETILYFEAGESKTLDYTMSGQESYTITKPDGWRASITAEGLVITAPAAENTYAETSGTVSVILFASNGQSFMAELTVAVVPVKDIDLWKNTATFDAALAGNGAEVFYKKEDASEWIKANHIDGTLFELAPVWNKSANGASLDVYSLEAGTGIFAGSTYQIEARSNGETVMSYEFTTSEGDEIPNGDMSAWSMKSGNLPYPNAEGESFWDSGNNSMSPSLCVEDSEAAYMSATKVLNFVFAPGNMYTGDFVMAGFSGTANFGKVYNWTARPKALKVDYKAEVGEINETGSSDPDGDAYEGKQDTSRIYAVVIDWTAQHGVTSGLGTPTGMWDPTIATSLEEGAIIGYAMLDITASQADFTTVEIPFVWYDTEAKPAEGNYSVVISCATSKRGDYLTGCSTNKLWVDNFEWAY